MLTFTRKPSHIFGKFNYCFRETNTCNPKVNNLVTTDMRTHAMNARHIKVSAEHVSGPYWFVGLCWIEARELYNHGGRIKSCY